VHLTRSSIDWYVARGAGVAAWLLLTTAVALGLAMAGRAPQLHQPRSAFVDVHRFASMLARTWAWHTATISR